MSMPKRVRVEGDFFHGRVPDGAVYVGRPAPGLKGSPFANPYRIGDLAQDYEPRTAEDVVRLYRISAEQWWPAEFREAARRELAGRDLACWCKPGQPCHVDVLLEVANS